jgi:hypothetical protein
MNPVVNYFASFPSLALKEGKKYIFSTDAHQQEKFFMSKESSQF